MSFINNRSNILAIQCPFLGGSQGRIQGGGGGGWGSESPRSGCHGPTEYCTNIILEDTDLNDLEPLLAIV